MFLESLIRLAEIVDHFQTTNTVLVSKDFQSQTEELIKSQTDYLMKDLEFKKDNPGPYTFWFGDLEITIYSPDDTDIQEWAALARKDTWQKAYRFNSILGLVKVLSLVIQDSK